MNSANSNTSWKSHLRILWAITRKDILDAIRNKNIIATLASSLFIVVLYRGLPLLESTSEKPDLLVYNENQSALVAALENSPAVSLFTYPSEEAMKKALSRSNVPELGVVIPAGFNQSLESGQPLPLQGYVVNWVNEKQARELESYCENEIGGLLGKPADIQIDGNVVYMTPQTDGYGLSVGFALILAVVMIGAISIPHLMMEEKKNHTIETLLISPASPVHVVIAKALAGLFYCMLGGVVCLVVNHFIVLHWWLALLAVFGGALFTVTLGLLLGVIVEDRAQLSMWAWIFMLPLILPLITTLFEDLLPTTILYIMRVIPSAVMFDLLRCSFAYSFDWGKVLLGIAWLLVCTGIGLGAVVWIIRHQSKRNEGSPLTLRSTLARPAPAIGKRPASKTASRVSKLKETPAGLFRSAAGKHTSERPHNGSLQIVAAIAAKDIRDAIRNKTLVSILIGVMFVVISGLSLPLFLGAVQKPAMVVYDPGGSTMLRELVGSPDFRLLIVDSSAIMQERLGAAMEIALGLVWPTNYDQMAGSGGIIEMEGYVAHWVKPDKTTEIVSYFEKQLSQKSGSSVLIHLASQRAYPSAKPGEPQNQIVTTTLATALLTIGFLLSPILIIEEKETHTFEALLISPASFGQVIIGKILAGMVYCLVASLGVLLFTHSLVVQWHILLLAILLGTAFAIGLGILMGLLCDSQATLGIWGGLVLLVLLMTGLMRYFDTSNWPLLAQMVIKFSPITGISSLTGLALSDQLPADVFLKNCTSLLAWSAVVYSLVMWVMHRNKHQIFSQH